LFVLDGSVRVVVLYYYIQRTAGDGGLIILLRSFITKASAGATVGQANSPTLSSSQRSMRLRSIALHWKTSAHGFPSMKIPRRPCIDINLSIEMSKLSNLIFCALSNGNLTT